MDGLLGQLGIDWKLFLSQAVNFFILLLILRAFVYKPLLNVIKERNRKIKEGLEKAEEANVRLREIDNISKEKLKEADLESINIIKNTELKAKQLEQALILKAEKRQKDLMAQVELSYKKQQEEAKQNVVRQASELVRKFIVKTVELKPEAIDDALIKKAMSEIKNHEPR